MIIWFKWIGRLCLNVNKLWEFYIICFLEAVISMKVWNKMVFLFCFITIGVIVSINYIVDPHGINHKYKIAEFNFIKYLLRDERNMKFNHLQNNDDYKAVILGTSKGAYLDTAFVEKYTKLKTYNASFSGGGVDEFLLYTKWLVKNRNIKLLIIDFEFYSFSDFKYIGSLPLDLFGEERNSKTQQLRQFFLNYLNRSVFLDSLRTIIYNKFYSYKFGKESADRRVEFYKKGMRYDKDYFLYMNSTELLEEHIKTQENAIIEWHGTEIIQSRVDELLEIKKLCTEYNVELVLLQNPSSYLQLRHNSYENYKQLLSLVKYIVKNINDVYFFNDLNSVNYNLEFFRDNLHFNYSANENIFSKVFLDDGVGIKLTKENIEDFYDRTLKAIN